MQDEETIDGGQGFSEDADEDLLIPLEGAEDFKFAEEFEDEDPDKDH